MFEVAKLTERALTAIEGIQLPSTLGDSIVIAFNSHKTKVVMDLIMLKTLLIMKQMVDLVVVKLPWNGLLILWSVSDDWSYSQTGEDEGFGYVQWPIKAN